MKRISRAFICCGSTATELADDELWHTYMLLTRVEAAFRNLKTDLNLRPIFHHKEDRGDAHVLFSVLAYALSVTIHLRHRQHGPNLTTTARCWKLCVRSGWQNCRSRQPMATRLRSVSRCRANGDPASDLAGALDWTIPDRYLPPNLEAEPRRSVEWRRKSLFINESYPQSVELGLAMGAYLRPELPQTFCQRPALPPGRARWPGGYRGGARADSVPRQRR